MAVQRGNVQCVQGAYGEPAFEELDEICYIVKPKALYIGKLSLPADVIQFSWLYLFMVELMVQNTSKSISKKISVPCVSWN